MGLTSLLFGESGEKPKAVDVTPQIEGYIDKYSKQVEDVTSSPLYQKFYDATMQRLNEQEQMAISQLAEQMSARGIGDSGIYLGNIAKIQKQTQDAGTQYGLGLEQFLTDTYLKKYFTELNALSQSKMTYANQQFQADVYNYQNRNKGLIPTLLPVAGQIAGSYLGGQAMGSALADAMK